MGGQGMSPCTSATLGVSNPVPPAANSCKECWGSVGNLAEPTDLTWPYRASCVGSTRLSPSRAVPWLWADQHWLVKGRQTQTSHNQMFQQDLVPTYRPSNPSPLGSLQLHQHWQTGCLGLEGTLHQLQEDKAS